MMERPSEMYLDLFDPGWREREAEMHRILMELVPAKCSPTLIECPRCKNDIAKYYGLRATQQQEG